MTTTTRALEDDDRRTTYVLVDGENIDATLGSMLGRRPASNERPRWDRLLAFVEDTWGGRAAGLFFLAAHHELPMPFVQALVAIGFKPVPLSGRPDEKVVDIAIQRTLEALLARDADVLLVSNDGDFTEQVSALLDAPPVAPEDPDAEPEDRRVGVVGFAESRSTALTRLREHGLEIFDLEYDVHAFRSELPRLRIIPIEEFDPLAFL